MWSGMLPSLALPTGSPGQRAEGAEEHREMDIGGSEDVVTLRFVAQTPSGPICRCAPCPVYCAPGVGCHVWLWHAGAAGSLST